MLKTVVSRKISESRGAVKRERRPGVALLAFGLVAGVLASLVATIAIIHTVLRPSHRADWFFYSGAYLFKPSANVTVAVLLLVASVAVELAPWLAMIGLHLPRAIETTGYWLLRIPFRILVGRTSCSSTAI